MSLGVVFRRRETRLWHVTVNVGLESEVGSTVSPQTNNSLSISICFSTHPPSLLSPRQSVDSANTSSAEQTQSVPSAVQEEDGKGTAAQPSLNVSEVSGRVLFPGAHADPVMSAHRCNLTTAHVVFDP